MVRISKKDRNKRCPRKPHYGSIQSGPKKDNLPQGYKPHVNAYEGTQLYTIFIPKIQ